MDSCHSWSYLPTPADPVGVLSIPPPELNSCNIDSTLLAGLLGEVFEAESGGGPATLSGRASTSPGSSLPNSFFPAFFTAPPPEIPSTPVSIEFRRLQTEP